ncbi:hypothetical protein JX266_011360 [Neoarthrinium moseri]|nr:hypothetical protein JX266_011360 [Neoarthrinium moseri]
MGQSSSSSLQQGNTALWPKVQTLEQFQERFRTLFASGCISEPEAEWLETITAKFGTTAEDSISWTESNLADFLAITLPDHLQADLQIMRPLMHRCMLRLSSFPYLNRPRSPLGNDSMRMALSILLQRHEQVGRPIGITNRETGSLEKQAHGLRSLLFQSMRSTQMSSGIDAKKGEKRTEADDEFLLQAHQFVSSFNDRRPESRPTVIECGPPIIPVQELPSSNSADYSGTIPEDEFKSLVKGSELCNTNGPGTVGWENFEAVFSSDEVNTTSQEPALIQ